MRFSFRSTIPDLLSRAFAAIYDHPTACSWTPL
jgi:hypothetical protein